jgi:hypothetical protein
MRRQMYEPYNEAAILGPIIIGRVHMRSFAPKNINTNLYIILHYRYSFTHSY